MTDFLEFFLLGLGSGAAYALLALGVVLVYRGSGVVNFSHGALAVFGLASFFELRGPCGTEVSILIATAMSAVLGVVIQLVVMRPLRSASPLVRVVATLAVLTVVEESAIIRFGENPVYVSGVFPTTAWHLFGGIVVSGDRMYMLIVGAALTIVLWWIYKYSRFGLATVAVAESERVTASLGWSPNLLAMGNWAVGGALAGLAGCLLGPITNLDAPTLTLAVVPALAAGLLGGFSSFPLTFLGGLLIGVLESETTLYVASPGWSSSVPFLVILAVLVIRGRALPLRSHRAERLPSLGTGELNRTVLAVGGGVVLISLLIFSANWSAAMITGGVYGLICLSLVVVVGYCGQLSLAQFALAGIGALVAGRLGDTLGLPFFVAVLFGVIGAVLVGVVVALPAVRIRGVNLAVVTLGLAEVISDVILSNSSYTGGAVRGTVVAPPTLFGWSLLSSIHPSRYAALVIASFLICSVLVANLRRGHAGRRLISIRNNERAAASLGVSVIGGKIFAFALSAGIAGLAGSLLAYENVNVVYGGYGVLASITSVLYAVLGGVGYIGGAANGGVGAPGGPIQEIMSHFFTAGNWYLLVSAALVIGVLKANPNGIFGAMVRQWAWLRRRTGRSAVEFTWNPPRFSTAAVVPPRVLEVDGLVVRFGGVIAVNDVTLRVEPGQIVGLIGPNGAGKTTVIDAISGFHSSYGGSVRLAGQPIDDLGPVGRARAGITRSFQSLELFEDLTVLDNLRVACDTHEKVTYVTDLIRPGRSDLPPAAAMAVSEFELEAVLDKKPSELPYAQRSLVAIARAVAASPSILMLDEPAAGLDEHSRDELARLIRRLAKNRGIGILLIEHDVSLVMSLCDWIEVLNFGQTLASGTPSAVRQNPAVIAAYLGTDQEPKVESGSVAEGPGAGSSVDAGRP